MYGSLIAVWSAWNPGSGMYPLATDQPARECGQHVKPAAVRPETTRSIAVESTYQTDRIVGPEAKVQTAFRCGQQGKPAALGPARQANGQPRSQVTDDQRLRAILAAPTSARKLFDEGPNCRHGSIAPVRPAIRPSSRQLHQGDWSVSIWAAGCVKRTVAVAGTPVRFLHSRTFQDARILKWQYGPETGSHATRWTCRWHRRRRFLSRWLFARCRGSFPLQLPFERRCVRGTRACNDACWIFGPRGGGLCPPSRDAKKREGCVYENGGHLAAVY